MILYDQRIKMVLDRFFALLLLLCLFPIFILIAVLVLFINGSPIIFRQERPGLNEKIFTIFKFRTMKNEHDSDGNLLPDINRITRFGMFLRTWSLDELPELLNILKGDMSFVGPRPLLIKYLPLYNDVQKRRHSVKPGLTGWAQINGRNVTTWEARFDHDIYYVDNISFGFDLKIVLRTLLKVIKRDGINSSKNETMEEFQIKK